MRSKRFHVLVSIVAVVGLGAAACGDDDDNGDAGGDTTAATTATTAASGDPCSDVTEAMVESGLSGFSEITSWECAADSDDRPWVGGSGVLESDGSDADFVLETGADVAFVEYTGSCENPPVPESLLTYCES